MLVGYRKITGMGVEGSWLWEKILNDCGEGGTEKGKKGTSSEWRIRSPVVFFLRCCQDWNYSSSFCLLDSVHWATWDSALYLGSPQRVGKRHCKFLSDWSSSAHHLPDISFVGFATVLGVPPVASLRGGPKVPVLHGNSNWTASILLWMFSSEELVSFSLPVKNLGQYLTHKKCPIASPLFLQDSERTETKERYVLMLSKVIQNRAPQKKTQFSKLGWAWGTWISTDGEEEWVLKETGEGTEVTLTF